MKNCDSCSKCNKKLSGKPFFNTKSYTNLIVNCIPFQRYNYNTVYEPIFFRKPCLTTKHSSKNGTDFIKCFISLTKVHECTPNYIIWMPEYILYIIPKFVIVTFCILKIMHVI